jgi:glycosyltransferase involved in cell wall biosynthesis
MICQLTTAHTLQDERIYYRMAQSSAAMGYHSSVVGPGQVTRSVEGVHLVSCPRIGKRSGKIGRIRACLSVSWWALRNRHDIYQVHDPDLLPVSILLKLLGRRVIYDVHEDYQASLFDRMGRAALWLNWLAVCWWAFERTVARIVDAVVVVNGHLAEKFEGCHVVILPNYPPRDFVNAVDCPSSTTFNILYVGGISRERGVAVLRAAMQMIPQNDIRLHLVGHGNDPELNSSLTSDFRIVHHGWIAWPELPRYYQFAHIGIAVYQPRRMFENVDHSVKIIEYMAAGIPVITSDFTGLRTLVEGNGIGFVIDPTSPESLAEAIMAFYKDPDLRRRYGFKAREKFEAECSWETQLPLLAALYARILYGAKLHPKQQ